MVVILPPGYERGDDTPAPYRDHQASQARRRPPANDHQDDRGGPVVRRAGPAAAGGRERDHECEEGTDPRSHRSLPRPVDQDARPEGNRGLAGVQGRHKISVTIALQMTVHLLEMRL